MIDAVDSELRERFAALADPTDDSDWRELRPRSRVTVVAVAAALALVVVVAASAIGVPGKVVRLFDSARPAPSDVARSFNDFDQIVSANLAAPPREVVETRGATLWVAPTTTGGYCSLVKLRLPDGGSEGAGGECGPRPTGLAVDVSLGGSALVRGTVGQRKSSSLELEFEDGDTAPVSFVWVSEPIATGFFVYVVPKRHLQRGHYPTRLTVLTADRHELAGADLHGFSAP